MYLSEAKQADQAADHYLEPHLKLLAQNVIHIRPNENSWGSIVVIIILCPTKACGALVTQTTLLPAASSLERRFPIVAIYFSH